MMNLRFSIVTPTWNCVDLVAETLDSILAQGEWLGELIVVDGGSTDGTLELLQDYAARDRRIHWRSEPDDGIADAFNKGLDRAQYPWIGILAAGDRFVSGGLARVAATIAAHSDVDVVHGDLVRLDEAGRPLFVITPSGLKTVWHQMPVNHPATFVSRSAYDQVGRFDVGLRIAMDYDLILRLYRAGRKFVYLPQPLTEMRYGGVSDNRLLAGLQEVRRVALRQGYPRWKADYWLAHRYLLERTKKWLRRCGLQAVMKLHPRFRRV